MPEVRSGVGERGWFNCRHGDQAVVSAIGLSSFSTCLNPRLCVVSMKGNMAREHVEWCGNHLFHLV
jgi:hypothetical protein